MVRTFFIRFLLSSFAERALYSKRCAGQSLACSYLAHARRGRKREPTPYVLENPHFPAPQPHRSHHFLDPVHPDCHLAETPCSSFPFSATPKQSTRPSRAKPLRRSRSMFSAVPVRPWSNLLPLPHLPR